MDHPSVFLMGSGEIAVPVFDEILKSDALEFAGIATQPDRPSGRKKIPAPTPVGKWAAAKGIAILKPESVNSQDFLDAIRGTKPDFLLVASFGQILRTKLLETPATAPVNVHASILPKHRGASPIAAAVLAGDDTTGISFMEMDEGLDTGPVYRVLEMGTDRMNAAELERALGELAAERVVETLLDIAAGRLQPTPQNHAEATLTKKIRKNDGAIDWNAPAERIERMSRAFQPWPGAFFRMETAKRTIKITITDAEAAETPRGIAGNARPGETLSAGDTWLVACGEKALDIRRLIPEGSKEMSSAEFLRGRREVEQGFQLLPGKGE